MEILQNLNDKGLTIVLVTHEQTSQVRKRVIVFRMEIARTNPS